MHRPATIAKVAHAAPRDLHDMEFPGSPPMFSGCQPLGYRQNYDGTFVAHLPKTATVRRATELARRDPRQVGRLRAGTA
jgi:hypothetical protein